MDGIVSLLTTTEGRISRKQWWIGLLVIVAIAIGLTIVLSIISFGNLLLLSWGGFIISLALLWPSYCIGIKRRHDRDNDGRDLVALIGASEPRTRVMRQVQSPSDLRVMRKPR